MRRYLVILAALAAAVAGVVVLGLFREPTLGLDLQGGLELVYEAVAPRGGEITEGGMENSRETMRERIDRLGVSEPEIRLQGENQITIGLAGVHDPGRAAEIVGKTAQLQFFKLEADLVSPSVGAQGFPAASPRLLPLLSGQQKRAEEGTPSAWYLYSKNKTLLAGPGETKEELLAQLEDGKAPAGAKYYAVPEDRVVVTCGPPTDYCPDGQGGLTPDKPVYYLFKYQPADPENPIPELVGSDLELDGTRQDFQGGQPIVTLQFTGKGGDKFHGITRDLAQRGRLRSQQLGVSESERIEERFAIVLDGEMRSAPTIDWVENPDGIAGGRAQITGLSSREEARDLALVLQTGALPYTFVQVERTDISATLGEDSLREAFYAAIGGLLAVALFLLVFYRFLGLIAVIGLAIYGVLLYGAILLFNVTLTLPGIAGLVLTIGVAADANIVIFERIKEEVRAGKSVRAAIGAGYRKGFNTIVDANVVTMITAFILFAVATSGVKGFALMLLLGTLLSMLTAVAATRALLGLLAGFRWFDNPAFMGASAQKIPAWQRIDFAGKRRVWFAFSAAVIAIGIVSLGLRGLNLGIDFKGGSQLTFETRAPVAVEDVRSQAAAIGREDAIIQGRGDVVNGGYTSFDLKTASLSPAEQTELQQALERRVGADAFGVKNVSSSFSEQILRQALIAIVVSLVLIVVYVSLRFQLKFALPVLVALVHDILITLGVYSLTGREMTASTVAAVLTILGYSIYDTIIIFDRVRENVPLMRRSSFAAIANQSLWETVRRSLATTFITLLPVAALFLFGGDTLKDFAFALLVGIGSGAYSTIFIATPYLVVLKEREPEYAKRKDAGLVEKLDALELEPRRERAPAVVAVEAKPAPEPEPAATDGGGDGAAAAARREERRKRRRARPHGRAR